MFDIPLEWFLLGALLLLVVLARLVLVQGTRARLKGTVGALVQAGLGLIALATVTYTALYFLSLTGGFYESLTCKVVTLPSCELPLDLPAWLRLPEQSAGAVIGILPLLGIYLAKVLQNKTVAFKADPDATWQVNLARQTWHWLTHNAALIFVLIVELWLAALRGAAEAADREVRISLGLDSELPAIYLSVARWGAVVLALGLSVVVVYLGIVGRQARLLWVRGFTGLEYGAGFVGLFSAAVSLCAEVLLDVWRAAAIALGRTALKLQSLLYGVWRLVATTIGRLALKGQSLLHRSWAFLAINLGRPALALQRLFRRRAVEALILTSALSMSALAEAKTYVVLVDATGSEAQRLEVTRQTVLGWADPSPQRALLEQEDRLVVIPIVAPGNLDPVYSVVFNATYPSSQLDRYAFFTELRDSLPTDVDSDSGTGLSDSLRVAAIYLAEAQDETVLIVFGNGEDHSADPISAEDLASGLTGGAVAHLNLGLDVRERWGELYRQAGARAVALLDLAATRSLREGELRELLE